MRVEVRDVGSRTGQVIDAIQASERVVLTVDGEPIADIVPRGGRTQWLPGERLREQLLARSADAGMSNDLDELVGRTLDEM